MKLPSFSFQTFDWSKIPKEERKGETGFAVWQVLQMGEIRVRKLHYSPNYKADHWCKKGHIMHCVDGEMVTELENGRQMKLTAGMTYIVG